METVLTSNIRSGVRRNLNESFNDSGSISSPIANYSIASVEEENELVLKLRKSTKNPHVILKKSDVALDKYRKSSQNDYKDNFENPNVSELRISFKNKLEIDEHSPQVYIEQLSPEKLKPLLDVNKKVICDSDLYETVEQVNNNKSLRRSARKVQRISYADFDSPYKTSKRNRKLSTSSDSSAGVSSEYLSPSKKTNKQISRKSTINTPITNYREKHVDSNHNSNNEKINSPAKYGRKGFAQVKHSTPLSERKHESPENRKSKRNINIPVRYCDIYDDVSPKKLRKTSRQCSGVCEFDGNEKIKNQASTPKLRNCVVNVEKCNIQDHLASGNKINSDVESILKLHNLRTPKKNIRYEDEDTKDRPNKGVMLHDENIEMKTPSKKIQFTENNQTPKSTYKNTPSAKAKLIREGTITPSVQMRTTPIQTNRTPLNKARVKLHVSYVPKVLACREKEYNDILSFLEGKLLDECGGCMYVSGVPGTGKTATVTDVIRKLEHKSKRGIVPNFQFVNVNGMKLSEPRQSYVEILKQLTGRTLSWEQAQLTLDNRFTKNGKASKPIILLVDELDILCTKRQDVVYNLLDWPTRASVQLIVITIANTMDLPERLLMGRVTSRLGLTRLTFQAYTHKQLQEIVTMRLVGTKVFNPDAVQLVARKVASVSGDARRALDICRRAAELAELEGPDTLVNMNHVNEALNAMITQPKVKAIKYCSRLQQLILQAVVAEVERTGVEETTFSDVYTMFQSIASIDGFQTVSCTLALAAVSKLGVCRLLLTDQKFNDFHQKLILNVSADDVYYALRRE